MPWSLAGRLFKWGREKITRLWLLKTYQKSHEYKFKRYQLGAYWKPLGEYLEYSVRLAHSADHESVKSRVAFRAKGSLWRTSRFILSVRAWYPLPAEN